VKSRARFTGQQRRNWVLDRLKEADGPAYGELVGEVVAAFPEDTRFRAAMRAVRAVRDLMWFGLITTESDESCYLTPAGLNTMREDQRDSV
jgi:hypothetical protein